MSPIDIFFMEFSCVSTPKLFITGVKKNLDFLEKAILTGIKNGLCVILSNALYGEIKLGGQY